jgi:peptidoglycan hydrolase-like protein with peptidoglycan-binding domain
MDGHTLRNLKNQKKFSMKFSQIKNKTNRVGAMIIMSTTAMATLLGLPFLAQAATFTRQIDLGMSGSDVTALQQFLAADPTLYPEGSVTGYFGPLTAAAVGRYQTKNGLSSVGRVGPSTLALLNGTSISVGLGSGDVSAPILGAETVVTGRTSATFTWYTNEPATANVRYGYNWPFLLDSAPSVTSTGGPSTYQTVTVTGLNPMSSYFYVISSTDQSGNVNQTVGKQFITTN